MYVNMWMVGMFLVIGGVDLVLGVGLVVYLVFFVEELCKVFVFFVLVIGMG